MSKKLIAVFVETLYAYKKEGKLRRLEGSFNPLWSNPPYDILWAGFNYSTPENVRD
jgi:hypothetical protein